ncbi:type IV secretory system conjugative DNA transfer family protein [Kordiimonas sp.]|uniref:type IV secretory system conjugative DNA transfer family protein n=1 Tax=Kordiimonas sp. TaxID=1970157 RepID=UPI003A91477D
MAIPFNEHYRFGSAGWANLDDLNCAGLLGGKGLQLGYMGDYPLHLDSDAPMITFGGAGSGKTRDELGYVVCTSPGVPMLALDPRGELYEISRTQHTAHGDYAFRWEPASPTGHCCNPLDFLTPDSPTLHADIQFFTEGLIPLTGGNSAYFELKARSWADCILKGDVELHGYTSLSRLYLFVMSSANPDGLWGQLLTRLQQSQFIDVAQAASEMITKQDESPKEFGSVMGELKNHIQFLSSPNLRAALDDKRDAEPDENRVYFSISDLLRLSPPFCKIHLVAPAEFLGIWAPALRIFFIAAMILKARAPMARRILLLVDEAGQLGKFEALLRAFTYGRGAGVRTWAIFQDTGQIKRNFSTDALQSFIGSAQVRQFFGVRDYDTAKFISDMLGQETLQYNNDLAQDQARQQRMKVFRSILNGTDPFEAASDYAHYHRAESHRSVQSRRLMTPDEILNMPEDRQILFVSGKNLKPIFGHKYPYYTRPEMVGRYLPNPYHPPLDRVLVAGQRSLRVITEQVPEKFALYPQHSDGIWSYCEGYRPH